MTYLELKRREAQALYREEQAYLSKNEGEIKRMMDEDLKERERAAREAGGSLFAVLGALVRGGAPPPGKPVDDKGGVAQTGK